MRAILVVLLYGYLDERRREKEIRGYQDYLNSAARWAVRLFGSGKLLQVILAGGLTDPSQGKSEAESICHQFRLNLGVFRDSLPIDLEKASKNSTQNIANAISQAQADGLNGQFIFICDRVRWFRIWVLARRICKREGVRLGGVIGIPRRDTHPHSRWLRQTVLGVYYALCPYSVIEAEINS